MTAEQWLEQLGFLLVALFTLGSALGVILARRVLHAALWLLPTLFGVAGVFGLLGAHVLFAMQIMVYVGAITVLIMFAVLLMEDDARERLPRFLRYRVPPRLRGTANLALHYYAGLQHVLGGALAAGMMLVVILAALADAAWYRQWKPLQPERVSQSAGFAGDNVRLIGELFLTRYLLPFEVASVVLLVALVGAVIIARRDRPAAPAPAESDQAVAAADAPPGASDEPRGAGEAR